MISDLVHPSRTAILVVDMQHDFCDPEGRLAKALNHDTTPILRMTPKLDAFLVQARNANIPVIFIRMNEHVPSKPPNFRRKKRDNPLKSCCIPGTRGFEYHAVKPQKGDGELVKTSYDAFSNPALGRMLARRRIKNIIITGVLTPYCVDSTARTAFGQGLHVVIPREPVAATRQMRRQHEASLQTLSDLFAHVVGQLEITSSWKK